MFRSIVKFVLLIILIFFVLTIVTFLHFIIPKPYYSYILFAFAILTIFLVFRICLIEAKVIKPKKRHRHSKIKKSKMSERFKELYKSIEKKYGYELERKRKKYILSILALILLYIASFAIFIFLTSLFNVTSKGGFKLFSIFSILIIMYGAYLFTKAQRIYKTDFKENVIKNLIKYTHPYMNYKAEGGNDLSYYYIDANFLDSFYTDIETDDYLYGYSKDGTPLKMVNISLIDNGNKGKNIFEGIFSVSQLNITLPDEVKILTNKISKYNNRVELDSQEFEKYFDVYSFSNILTLEVLTHDIMEEFVSFYKKYKIKFEVALKNNYIYIRFDTGRMFEPNILKKSYDMSTLWVYYNIINFVLSVTTKFNNLLKDLNV